MAKTVLLALWVIYFAAIAFADRAELEELEPEDIDNVVLKDKNHWFIMYFHTACVHCLELYPLFEQAANSLPEQVLRWGIVEVTGADPAWIKKHNLDSFPRLALYLDSKKPKAFNQPGWRSDTESKSKQLVQYARSVMKEQLTPELDTFEIYEHMISREEL